MEGKRILMRIIRTKNYDEMSRKAAAIIAAQVIHKPDCVLVADEDALSLV